MSQQAHAEAEVACLSRSEVAQRLGVTIETVRRLERGGHLTVIRLPGCRPRYPREAVERLLEASTHPSRDAG